MKVELIIEMARADANWQPVEQGAAVSGHQRNGTQGQTSEPVSPVETKTTTIGWK